MWRKPSFAKTDLQVLWSRSHILSFLPSKLSCKSIWANWLSAVLHSPESWLNTMQHSGGDSWQNFGTKNSTLCNIAQSHDSALCNIAPSHDSALCNIVLSHDSLLCNIGPSHDSLLCNIGPSHDSVLSNIATSHNIARSHVFTSLLRGWFFTSVAEPHHFHAAPASAMSKLLMWLWLLPYYTARQIFFNEVKFKHIMKLSCSFDSIQFILLNMNWMGWKLLHFDSFFNFLPCSIPLSEL
jgi:hypothetical protein